MRTLPLPIESGQVPSRPKSRTERLVRSVRSAVFLAVSLASLEGCVTAGVFKSPQQNAMEAYNEGRYLEAKAYYAKADSSKMTEEDLEQVQNINWMIDGLIGQFMKEASLEIQKGNYTKAIENYEYALLYTPSDHPNQKVAQKGIKDLRDKLVFYEKEYALQKKTLEDWLGTRKVDDEKLVADLNAAFKRIQALRPILKKSDKGPKGPYSLAVGFGKAFYSAGEYAKAEEMFRQARALDFHEGNYVEESEVTEADARLFAHNRVYDTTMSKQNRMVRIVQGMQKAMAEKRYDTVRKLAADANRVEPSNQFVAGMMEEVERLNPAPKPKPDAPRRAAAVSAPKGPTPEDLAAAEEATKDAVAQQAVGWALDQARKDYAAGKKMEAFVGIEKSISTLQGNKYISKISEQLEKWRAEKDELVRVTRENANRLYAEQDTVPAIKAFQDLKNLNPSEADRKLAEERIKWLEDVLKKEAEAAAKKGNAKTEPDKK